MRDRLQAGLLGAVPDTFVNGDPTRRTAGHLHVGFPGVESEALLVMLDQQGLCAAAGSSCSSGATEISHVLAAMGMDRAAADGVDPAEPRVRVDRRRRRPPRSSLIPAAVARLRAPVAA